MTPPVAEVLRGAADLIEKPGAWLQGRFCNGGDTWYKTTTKLAIHYATCWCAEGAIAKVMGVNAAKGEEFADRVFGYADLDQEDSLAAWNDAPGRTQAQVVAKLREAAALYEATHNPGERHG